MTQSQRAKPTTVAISTSDSPDMAAFGMGEGHLKEAMAELALQLLAVGANLAYGGDLRTYGFTRLLFRLVVGYTATADFGKTVRVTNHLAWPVHLRMSVDEIRALKSELAEFRGAAELVLLRKDGTRLDLVSCPRNSHA